MSDNLKPTRTGQLLVLAHYYISKLRAAFYTNRCGLYTHWNCCFYFLSLIWATKDWATAPLALQFTNLVSERHLLACRNERSYMRITCRGKSSILTNPSFIHTMLIFLSPASAAWHGTKIILRQVSPESTPIFDFIMELHALCRGDWKSLVGEDGITSHDCAAFLRYAATFLSNIGNYYVRIIRLLAVRSAFILNRNRDRETRSLCLISAVLNP